MPASPCTCCCCCCCCCCPLSTKEHQACSRQEEEEERQWEHCAGQACQEAAAPSKVGWGGSSCMHLPACTCTPSNDNNNDNNTFAEPETTSHYNSIVTVFMTVKAKVLLIQMVMMTTASSPQRGALIVLGPVYASTLLSSLCGYDCECSVSLEACLCNGDGWQ